MPTGSGGRSARRFLLGLTLLFAMGAVALLAGVFWPPLAATWRARSWTPVPCQIEESRVVEHTDSQGAKRFHVSVRYRYELSGRRYESDRVSFLPARLTNRNRAESDAQRLARNTARTCYTNPLAPGEAVLDRSFGRMTNWTLLPLLWVVITLAFLGGLAIRSRSR